MTVKVALTVAEAALKKNGIDNPRLDCLIMMELVIRERREYIMAHYDRELTKQELMAFQALVRGRGSRKPLVHITGKREFYGLELQITPDVLTPRVETEKMAEWAIKYAPRGSNLLDMGTGSGALAIAIAKNRSDLHVFASEVSPAALEVARHNSTKQAVNIKFIQSDLWQGITERFQTVVTNLPYLEDGAELMPEVQKEPAVALFGGKDGLGLYRRFLKDLPDHLEPGSYLFTESDPWQHEALIKEAKKYGLKLIEQDYFILGLKL